MTPKTFYKRTVAIIQARMGSTRLPGKVLFRLGGKAVLAHVVTRVKSSGIFDDVVVATTVNSRDDCVSEFAKKLGAMIFRGSETDVLARYAGAAEVAKAEIVVRITSDCPLIDPEVLSVMVKRFQHLITVYEKIPVLTNSRVRTFPRGLDTEIFTIKALKIADKEASEPHQREHVTPFMYETPNRFCIIDHLAEVDSSNYRLTLDTHEDYELLKKIFDSQKVSDSNDLSLSYVLGLLAANPRWVLINAGVQQKSIRSMANGK